MAGFGAGPAGAVSLGKIAQKKALFG